MTREEFISILDKKGYSYEIVGNKIVVNDEGDVDLESLTSLPPGVEFRNEGWVDLDSLTSLPSGVEFSNRGGISLKHIDTATWGGSIEGVSDIRLLLFMEKKGVFER